MKQFGIPYKGSKEKIAIDIIPQLPAGNRFVDFVVFGRLDKELLRILLDIRRKVQSIDIRKRRLEFIRYVKRIKSLNLDHLERLESRNIDYRQYEYQQGDIVYCDIPYEKTDDYGIKFDHKAFYDWAESRTYPVYFSSYPTYNDRFELIWVKNIVTHYVLLTIML